MVKGVAERNVYCLGQGVFDHPASLGNQKAYYIRKNHAVVEVMEDRLYYIPQIARKPDLFDYEFRCNLLPVLNSYQNREEIAFIDTGLKNSISSKIILNEADFVVVTLRQDLQEIQDFFQNYSSLSQKAFFIIGNYSKKCRPTLNKILSEFGFRRDRIGIVPHSEEFRMVAETGRMAEFISSRFNGCCTVEDKFFIQELKKTTFLLMQYAVFNNEKGN